MGGGNGAKAAQKRERNAKDKAGAAKSQLKTNEKALNIQCFVCKATFLSTTRENAHTHTHERLPFTANCKLRLSSLNDHATNKHSKTLADCFPDFKAASK
ncbi:uncharacterized protein SPSK_09984 [Sporothrix schenckii 1099-18]|uniref:C2H2-type domain-containing protein n=1 Tax=Sporothrix schenckii 1099-18 TaxID=1397361 RepID=A0A0F2M8E4_SPOSC|nr:uncharacterized protein SPSK_09984 [Sporothrix schenckii 1099-18]KJR85922.1 hypothetical protein SPSK_09984 [Sporothrix schenckii 1099-18]